MVSPGMPSLDGTKLAGNAPQKANKTLPEIEKLLAEAAKADAAEDAQCGGNPPRALARRAERRKRLAAARDRLAAEARPAATRSGPGNSTGFRPPPAPGSACYIPAAGTAAGVAVGRQITAPAPLPVTPAPGG
jgi:hypothetical protein